MANNVLKVNGIAIASIAKINGETDTDIAKLNGEEFTGVADAHTFIRSEPASADSSITFAHGTNGVVLDSTYDVYEWHFINMHPADRNYEFEFQVNYAGGSGFNETITSSYFNAGQNEGGQSELFDYDAGYDQAQTANYQDLARGQENDNDTGLSGVLTLYAPSSTTYVKHFIASVHNVTRDHTGSDEWDYTLSNYAAGYIDTTNAIDEIDFKFSSGNIDAGEIRMYGLALS